MTKKRSRSKSAQLVPTAAAFTVAGVLIGGAGTVIQLASPASADEIDSLAYDAAGYPLTNPTAGGWARQTDTDASSGAVMTVATPTQATVNRPAEHASTNASSTVKTTSGASTSDPSTSTPPAETPTEPSDTTDGSTTEQPTEPSTDPETDPPTEPDQTDPNAGGTTEGSCTATPAESTAEGLTATSSVLPAGAEVRVTNEATQQSIVVVITEESDTGCLSLSPAAFAAVAPAGMQVVDVHYAVLVEDAT